MNKFSTRIMQQQISWYFQFKQMPTDYKPAMQNFNYQMRKWTKSSRTNMKMDVDPDIVTGKYIINLWLHC